MWEIPKYYNMQPASGIFMIRKYKNKIIRSSETIKNVSFMKGCDLSSEINRIFIKTAFIISWIVFFLPRRPSNENEYSSRVLGVIGENVVSYSYGYKTNAAREQSVTRLPTQYLLARRPTPTRAACQPPPLVLAYTNCTCFAESCSIILFLFLYSRNFSCHWFKSFLFNFFYMNKKTQDKRWSCRLTKHNITWYYLVQIIYYIFNRKFQKTYYYYYNILIKSITNTESWIVTELFNFKVDLT